MIGELPPLQRRLAAAAGLLGGVAATAMSWYFAPQNGVITLRWFFVCLVGPVLTVASLAWLVFPPDRLLEPSPIPGESPKQTPLFFAVILAGFGLGVVNLFLAQAFATE